MTCKDSFCVGSHNKPVKAVGRHWDQPVCRRHLNRALENERLREYRDNGPRCPTHPKHEPGITRWHGKPRLFCPQPTGDKVFYPARGHGPFRRPGGNTYTSYCTWTCEVPDHVIHAPHTFKGGPDLSEGTRGTGTEESSNERIRKEAHTLATLAFLASNLTLLPGHITQRHVDPT